MKKFMDDSGVFCTVLDSAEDLMASGDTQRLNRQSDNSWIGGSIDSIQDALVNGMPSKQRDIEVLVEEFRRTLPPPASVRRRQRWSDDGDEPSWEREQSGHEEIWRTSRRTSARGPQVLNLQQSWGGLGHLSAEQLQWNGVVLATLCDLLEGAGYRISAAVNHCATSFGGHARHVVTQVNVKSPDMPLNLATMTPVVCHSGVYRYYGLNVADGNTSTMNIMSFPKVSIIPQDALKLAFVTDRKAARAEIERVLALFTTQEA